MNRYIHNYGRPLRMFSIKKIIVFEFLRVIRSWQERSVLAGCRQSPQYSLAVGSRRSTRWLSAVAAVLAGCRQSPRQLSVKVRLSMATTRHIVVIAVRSFVHVLKCCCYQQVGHSLHIIDSLSIPPSLSVCFLFICLCLCLRLSLYDCLCFCPTLCLRLCLCLYLSLSLSLFCLFLCLFLCLCLCSVSVCLCLSACLSVCLSVCLSLSVYIYIYFFCLFAVCSTYIYIYIYIYILVCLLCAVCCLNRCNSCLKLLRRPRANITQEQG